MKRIQSVSNAFAGRAGVLAGSALVASGIVQAIHSQRHTSRVVGLAGHLSLGFMAVGLLSMWPAYIALSRCARGRSALPAALAVTAGTVALGLTCIYPLVHGRDPGIFPVLAGATNGAWLIGSLVLAVALKRSGRVPVAVAAGLPFVWLFSIIGAGFGGGLVSGGYLLAVGYLIASDAIERRPTADLTRAAA